MTDEPTAADHARDLAAGLWHCRHPESIDGATRDTWFRDLAEAACRRALSAEARLVRMTLRPADRRHELEEVLVLVEDADVGGYDPNRPLTARSAARDVLRRDCLDGWPAAARRAIAAEARAAGLERELAHERAEFEALAGVCAQEGNRLEFLRAALAGPPAGTRVEHDHKGNPIRILIPGVTDG